MSELLQLKKRATPEEVVTGSIGIYPLADDPEQYGFTLNFPRYVIDAICKNPAEKRAFREEILMEVESTIARRRWEIARHKLSEEVES